MSMASLYAMLGLAMPSGSAGSAAASPAAGVSPDLALASAANATEGAELGALASATGESAATTGSADLTSALMSLANLDPILELQRLEASVNAGLQSAAQADTNGTAPVTG